MDRDTKTSSHIQRILCFKVILTALFALMFWSLPTKVATAEENQKVNWVFYELPPFFISTPELSNHQPPGQGPATDLVKQAMVTVKNFKHEFHIASIRRVTGLMKSGVLACNPMLLKVAEREKYIEFSYPSMMALPQYVVILEENAFKLQPFINENGRIDLNQLTTNSTLLTSTTQKRAYPKIVMDAFAKANKHNYRALNTQDFKVPIKQLFAERIDYLIAYPFELTWYANKTGNPIPDSLIYIPIEGMPEYVLAHVGCTKNEQGKKVISQINQMILNAGPRPAWNEVQFNYLDDNARRELEKLINLHQPFGPIQN